MGAGSPVASRDDSSVIGRSGNLLTGLFALLAGAMIFLPSVLGAIKAPYVLNWLLPTFWIAGCVALVSLSISLYLVRFAATRKPPNRLMGFGMWFAMAALLSLAVYVAVNIWQDRIASPEIIAVDIAPISPEPGELVKLSAVAATESGNHLTYRWRVDNRDIGSGQTIYWISPQADGRHNLDLTVGDGRPDLAIHSRTVLPVKKKGLHMIDREKLVNAAIRSALAQIQQRTEKRYIALRSALDGKGMYRLAEDFDPADEHSQQLLLEGAFLRTVVTLNDTELQEWLSGKRVCCSAYPGTWPFCDPNC